MNDDKLMFLKPQKVLSLMWVVLPQLLFTVLGFLLLFTTVQRLWLRYQFSLVSEEQLEAYSQSSASLSTNFHPFSKSRTSELIAEICSDLPCQLESLQHTKLQRPDEKYQRELLKVIVDVDVLLVPLLVEFLTVTEMNWTCVGLEVHAYTQPSKVMMRFERSIPSVSDEGRLWVSRLHWSEAEQQDLETLNRWRLLKDFREFQQLEIREARKQWSLWMLELNKGLWQIHQSPGTVVLSPKTGVQVTLLPPTP